MQQAFPIGDSSQLGAVRRVAAELAAAAGLNKIQVGRVSIIASELATNLLKFGRDGIVFLRRMHDPDGIELLAVDKGPGLGDAGNCLRDGFSTSGTAGNGLGAVRRQSDAFDLWSDPRGSVVLAQVHLAPEPETSSTPGVICQALHGETACGDAWTVRRDGEGFSAVVVDGLGHGIDASIAAHTALRVFADDPARSPRAAIEAMHDAMGGTRGAAVAVVQGDYQGAGLTYCGIGNISGTIVSPTRSRGLVNHNGIVGGAFHRAQQFDYGWDTSALLILHSDGLQTRWKLEDYPGLARRHPALVAAVLHRDFCRQRDDVTVLVLPLPMPHS